MGIYGHQLAIKYQEGQSTKPKVLIKRNYFFLEKKLLLEM